MKINYQQRYLDEELKNHVQELLGQLKDVPSEDEEDAEEEKENLNDEIEFETDSEDEEEKNDNNMDVV